MYYIPKCVYSECVYLSVCFLLYMCSKCVTKYLFLNVCVHSYVPPPWFPIPLGHCLHRSLVSFPHGLFPWPLSPLTLINPPCADGSFMGNLGTLLILRHSWEIRHGFLRPLLWPLRRTSPWCLTGPPGFTAPSRHSLQPLFVDGNEFRFGPLV